MRRATVQAWVMRLGQLIWVVVGVTFISFAVMNVLPGDLPLVILGEGASPEARAALGEELGLEEPIWERYLDWLGGAVRGDLGTSLTRGTDVTDTLANRIPVTFEIAGLSLLLAVTSAVVVATIAARYRSKWQDTVANIVSYAGIASPPFLVGLLLIYLFSVQLRWLPATGWYPISEGVGDHVRGLVMPVLSLAIVEFAMFMRVLRSDLVTQLADEDYPWTARAKGLPWRTVIVKHVLRNSALPFITVVGLQFGVLLGGAVIIESLFAVPGVGQLLVSSTYERDVITVQGVVVFIALVFVVVNMMIDAVYVRLDPRVRYEAETL